MNSVIPSRIVLALFSLASTALVSFSCTRAKDELFIIPPPTHPLSRPVIGYGVIKPSYTNLSGEPKQEGLSQGYMRRGSVVRVLERRAVIVQGGIELLVLVEGGYRGWLKEDEVDVYDYEAQAKTASEMLGS